MYYTFISLSYFKYVFTYNGSLYVVKGNSSRLRPCLMSDWLTESRLISSSYEITERSVANTFLRNVSVSQ